jgi:hypothetical protein
MYPLHYQPLTTNVEFYKNWSFEVASIVSPVSIDLLTLDRAAYAQGEDVSVSLWLSSTGVPQDVLVETTIRDGSSGEVVDGLPLRNLHDLSGPASLAMVWSSAPVEAGDYAIDVVLRDTEGNTLDRAAQGFRLGTAAGEIASLTATPGMFKAGDTIAISMIFSNTGSVPITGTAYIHVQDADGAAVTAPLTHTVQNLGPGSAVTLNDAWNTAGATGESYRIVGYVLYESKSTAIERVTVSTTARVYLPIVLRGRQ